MQLALESGLFALGGAAIGGAFSTWLTYRLNERTRRIDLYKTFYPKKMEIAQRLATDAYFLVEEATYYSQLIRNYDRKWLEDETPKEEKIKKSRVLVAVKTEAFQKSLLTDVWLLEHETIKSAFQFHTLIREVVETPKSGDTARANGGCVQIMFALRREMNLPTISNLFRDDGQWLADMEGITKALTATKKAPTVEKRDKVDEQTD